MAVAGGWRVGTLGGPGTFAGQATEAAVAQLPHLGPVEYYSTVDAVWEAARSGAVDCAVLTGETTHTGLTDVAIRLLDRAGPLFVAGEVIVPFRCMLLGRPGSRVDQVKLVLGHGSLHQCGSFLSERLPHAQVRVHKQNSLAAAQEVLDGDGTVAVVGTLRSAQEHGLSILAPDVDRGSEGAWWLLTGQPRASAAPDAVIVGVRSEDRDVLRGLLERMRTFDLLPRSIATVSQGSLFRYAHLAVFTGAPITLPVADLVQDLTGCHVIGAFTAGRRGHATAVSPPP